MSKNLETLQTIQQVPEIISGTLDVQFNNNETELSSTNLQDAIQELDTVKAPINSPVFTGNLTTPSADINGGTIDGTIIGGTTRAAGNFTTGNVDGLFIANSEGVLSQGASGIIIKGSNLDNNWSGGISFKSYNNTTVYNAIANSTNGMFFHIGSSSTMAERVRIAASGNVGIGTTEPTAKLDVNGTAKFNGNVTVNAGNLLVGTSTDNGVDRLQVNGNVTASNLAVQGFRTFPFCTNINDTFYIKLFSIENNRGKVVRGSAIIESWTHGMTFDFYANVYYSTGNLTGKITGIHKLGGTVSIVKTTINGVAYAALKIVGTNAAIQSFVTYGTNISSLDVHIGNIADDIVITSY